MKEKCWTFSLRRLILKPTQTLIIAAILLFNCFSIMAQTSVKVKGVVTSEADGFPLTGVNVVQKGSTNGVVTDLDGNFELTVPVGSAIEVSYIGFIPQTQQVTGGGQAV